MVLQNVCISHKKNDRIKLHKHNFNPIIFLVICTLKWRFIQIIHLHSWHPSLWCTCNEIIRTHLTEFFPSAVFQCLFFSRFGFCFLLSLSSIWIFLFLFLRHWYAFVLSIDYYGIKVQLEYSKERKRIKQKICVYIFNHKTLFYLNSGPQFIQRFVLYISPTGLNMYMSFIYH